MAADRNSPEYLEELAQRADPDNLWQRNPFDQLEFPPEQRMQLDTAVALRRYAGLIRDMERAAQESKSLVLTRLGPSTTARDFAPMKKWHLESVERRRAARGVPVVDDGQEWEQAAREVVANPRPIEEIKRDIADVMKRVDEAAAGVLESDAALHTFLNAAAGEGLVLDGVDAADLYIATFPEHYRATVASIEGDPSGVTATFLPCSFCKTRDACKVSGCVDAKIGRAIAAGERAASGVPLPSQAALDSQSVQMPQGFTPEERRAFILGVAAAGKAGVAIPDGGQPK